MLWTCFSDWICSNWIITTWCYSIGCELLRKCCTDILHKVLSICGVWLLPLLHLWDFLWESSRWLGSQSTFECTSSSLVCIVPVTTESCQLIDRIQVSTAIGDREFTMVPAGVITSPSTTAQLVWVRWIYIYHEVYECSCVAERMALIVPFFFRNQDHWWDIWTWGRGWRRRSRFWNLHPKSSSWWNSCWRWWVIHSWIYGDRVHACSLSWWFYTGRLREGDQLMSVNGHSLESVTNSQAVSLLRQASAQDYVSLTVSRDEYAQWVHYSCLLPFAKFCQLTADVKCSLFHFKGGFQWAHQWIHIFYSYIHDSWWLQF